jgi:SAM-dependent methyltransferase
MESIKHNSESSLNSIGIDHEGYPQWQDIRVTDQNIGYSLLSSIHRRPQSRAWQALAEDRLWIVEAFDYPWVLQSLESVEPHMATGQLPYEVKIQFRLDQLRIDPWDRFVGWAYVSEPEKLVPFVMSRKAQAQFFELASDYTDESITFGDNTYLTPELWAESPSVEKSQYWNEKYEHTQTPPRWSLGGPHPALAWALDQIRINKSRALVLGCGEGHDAQGLNERGHIVDAVDFAPLAIEKAKSLYGTSSIRWHVDDIFSPKASWATQRYDLIFEHTCFPAVNPKKRENLVKFWHQLLAEQGYLLGIFLCHLEPEGPPFGITEWQLWKLLEGRLKPLYWQRLKSPPGVHSRLGTELLVLAQKM